MHNLHIMKILSVGNETYLSSMIDALKNEGHDVINVGGESSLTTLFETRVSDYDIVLIDSDSFGSYTIENIYANTKSPIVMFGADKSEEAVVKALDSGAADYFLNTGNPSVAIYLNKIEAIVRRHNGELMTPNLNNFSNVTIDDSTNSCTVDNQNVPLAKQPFNYLSRLMKQPGQVVTNQELYKYATGRPLADTSNPVPSSIKTLRRALEGAGAKIKISTVYRKGYRLTSTQPQP